MLEAGAKIYVCRVDKTKSSVMDLASTLNMQQRNKKRNEVPVEPDEPLDPEVDPNGEEPQTAKKKKKRVFKICK